MVRLPTSAASSPGDSAWIGHALGLTVHSTEFIAGVSEMPDRQQAPPNGRPVTVLMASGEDSPNPDRFPVRTFALRDRSGQELFTIDHGAATGYRVWIDSLGCCELSLDGQKITCVPPPNPDFRWRLLFAQALPIAAAIQGLEPLHASAVVVDGRALVISGDSGAGKTSAALHLLRHGAEFLADDVTAIEAAPDCVIAHPGLRSAQVADGDRSLIGTPQPAPGAGASGTKNAVIMSRRDAPARVTHVYFLTRNPDIDAVKLLPVTAPDPVQLLAASFVTHVPGPTRALNQLSICADIARTAALYELRAPISGDAAGVAAAIWQSATG